MGRSIPLVAKTDTSVLGDMLDHGLTHAGASPALLTDDARAALLRAARGLPRLLSHLLRLALLLADERASPQIDASIINAALSFQRSPCYHLSVMWEVEQF
ncbi:MAG: hypothetical protein IPK80_00920 [Nannocystis sp.]|nr:hypothetical protein [Nannocystis sp.]